MESLEEAWHHVKLFVGDYSSVRYSIHKHVEADCLNNPWSEKLYIHVTDMDKVIGRPPSQVFMCGPMQSRYRTLLEMLREAGHWPQTSYTRTWNTYPVKYGQ